MPTAHSKLRHDLNHYFKLNDIHISSVAETQDTSLQKLIAQHGIGLAPFSEVEVKEEGFIKIGKLKDVYEEIWLISAHRKLENPIASNLMNSFVLK